MENSIIGKSISELRKAKGITQEKLAEIIGVTPQAVSKWESGGNPDVELLPAIADFFEVSIDRLFSRSVNDYSNLEKELVKYVAGTPEGERMEKVFELCWAIEKGISGTLSLRSEDSLKAILENDNGYIYSQMLFNDGITLMSLRKELQYFLIMPEPEHGWYKELNNQENYLKLFSLLCNADVLKALFLLYHRENKAFTPKLLVKGLEISSERAVEILDMLAQYSLIYTSEIELDDEVQKIYNFSPNPAFVAMLTICKELIKKPNHFYWNSSYRNKPYLSE